MSSEIESLAQPVQEALAAGALRYLRCSEGWRVYNEDGQS